MSKSGINALLKTKYSKLLEFFMGNPNEAYYVNQLLAKVKLSPQVLCEGLRELGGLGILRSEKRANALYYQLNQKNSLVATLKKIIKPITYKDAGVDIDAANLAVSKMKPYVRGTFNRHVLSSIGSFGGLYQIDDENVLVASTDGVGTKIKVAILTGKHDTIGQDLVNHCVNDILVMGAKPLFFLDYIGTGKVNPDIIGEIVRGLAKACKENHCALIGGETAEMPGIYREKDYDLASCIVGKVKKKEIIDGSNIKAGDIIIGLLSNGLHTNGYSLAIKVLLEHAGLKLASKPKGLDCTLGEELLKIHTSYLNPIAKLVKKFDIKGMAHITGGGLLENIPRILPKNVNVQIKKDSWTIPPIFRLIQNLGNIPESEMFRVYNMGIGFVVVIDQLDLSKVTRTLPHSMVIGQVTKGIKKVLLT